MDAQQHCAALFREYFRMLQDQRGGAGQALFTELTGCQNRSCTHRRLALGYGS